MKHIRSLFTLIITISVALAATVNGRAQDRPPSPIDEVGYDQKLNAQFPLDTLLRDEAGRDVRVGDFFGERPVVVLFAYYDCPMLCNLALADLVKNLNTLTLDINRDFQVVTISIDPGETSEIASRKKAAFIQQYERSGANEGWHFLTGEQASIDRLTEAAGFRYSYDPETDEYAHPTGVMILTPQGKISSYIFGIDYSATDLRLGLVEASRGEIGTPVDQFFLTCYHYNPQTGKYTLAITNILRIAGGLTVAGMVLLVTILLRRERSSQEEPPTETSGGLSRQEEPAR